MNKQLNQDIFLYPDSGGPRRCVCVCFDREGWLGLHHMHLSPFWFFLNDKQEPYSPEKQDDPIAMHKLEQSYEYKIQHFE